jgi:hypothetical protein
VSPLSTSRENFAPEHSASEVTKVRWAHKTIRLLAQKVQTVWVI